MYERDHVMRLDYLVRKAEIPDLFDSQKRECAQKCFIQGISFFSHKINTSFLKYPWWKLPKIITNMGRIYGSTLVYEWNNEELSSELNNYAEDGEARGDLSQRIEHARIATTSMSAEWYAVGYASEFRLIGVKSVVIAHDYVCSNIQPTFGIKVKRDGVDYSFRAGAKNNIDENEINDWLELFRRNEIPGYSS